MEPWTIENLPDEFRVHGDTGEPLTDAELAEVANRLNGGAPNALG